MCHRPVRLNLSARISQLFSSVFLSQQISISINISRFYSQPNRANDIQRLQALLGSCGLVVGEIIFSSISALSQKI
jgi:hypothetical protein